MHKIHRLFKKKCERSIINNMWYILNHLWNFYNKCFENHFLLLLQSQYVLRLQRPIKFVWFYWWQSILYTKIHGWSNRPELKKPAIDVLNHWIFPKRQLKFDALVGRPVKLPLTKVNHLLDFCQRSLLENPSPMTQTLLNSVLTALIRTVTKQRLNGRDASINISCVDVEISVFLLVQPDDWMMKKTCLWPA